MVMVARVPPVVVVVALAGRLCAGVRPPAHQVLVDVAGQLVRRVVAAVVAQPELGALRRPHQLVRGDAGLAVDGLRLVLVPLLLLVRDRGDAGGPDQPTAVVHVNARAPPAVTRSAAHSAPARGRAPAPLERIFHDGGGRLGAARVRQAGAVPHCPLSPDLVVVDDEAALQLLLVMLLWDGHGDGDRVVPVDEGSVVALGLAAAAAMEGHAEHPHPLVTADDINACHSSYLRGEGQTMFSSGDATVFSLDHNGLKSNNEGISSSVLFLLLAHGKRRKTVGGDVN